MASGWRCIGVLAGIHVKCPLAMELGRDDAGLQGGLDLLDGAGEQVADGVDRLHGELRRRQVVHQYLERHGDERAGAVVAAAAMSVGRRALGRRVSSRGRRGVAVGEDGKAGGQQGDVGRVAAAHDDVHGLHVHRRVHHQRAGRVGARLLQDEHVVLVPARRLQAN